MKQVSPLNRLISCTSRPSAKAFYTRHWKLHSEAANGHKAKRLDCQFNTTYAKKVRNRRFALWRYATARTCPCLCKSYSIITHDNLIFYDGLCSPKHLFKSFAVHTATHSAAEPARLRGKIDTSAIGLPTNARSR
jgi:hypothetical protein